jgi:hypothetical protein
MLKFIGVLGVLFVIASCITLVWPGINPNPRPEPLARLHEMLMKTSLGQHAANVLGVSDEHPLTPLTAHSIGQEILRSFQARVSNVVITHAIREIAKRFKDLPVEEQQRVLEEFSSAIDETILSSTQELPDVSQNSAERNSNSAAN